jgi:transcriptional regulator with XRE-family HTH domain
MDSKLDLLDIVVSQLEARQGCLTRLAEETGISYDTLLRIKNRENDPGYSKVRQLANHLGIVSAYAVPPAPTFCDSQ